MARVATRFRSPGAISDGIDHERPKWPAGSAEGRDRPPRPPGPSAKPAAIVFAIILVVFLAGAISDAITSSHHAPAPAPARGAGGPVAGSGGLTAVASSAVLAPIVSGGEPPPDVVAAVAVPRGTVAVPGTAANRSLGLFDASLSVQLPASEAQIIGFFRTELAAGRWHVLSAGAQSGGDYQFVAQHPGSDGNEWEIGITLSPTTFSSAVAGTSVPTSGTTPAVIRLFAVSDQS